LIAAGSSRSNLSGYESGIVPPAARPESHCCMRAQAVLALATFPFALAAASARAEPPPDPSNTFTVQIENDALNGTDRYYTSGLRLGWTSPTDSLPAGLSRIGHAILGDGQQRIALDLSQTLFTPFDTQISPPDPTDRPYAGVLLGSASLIQDTDRTRSVLAVGLGMIGPAALGEETQNGFHTIIGDAQNKGWGFQIPDQPVIQFTAQRIWRLPLATGGIEADVLPDLTAGAGTLEIYGLVGGQLRIGQGLGSDFGAPRILPGLTGSDAYVATRRFAWYVFAGVDGQAVGWNETLDGTPFGASAHVTRNPWVGEFQTGLVVIAYGVRFSFTHVIQTQEFANQHGGLFKFDSLAVSAKF